MTTWLATPTSQQETCWITYSRLTATSPRSTLRSTLNTCTGTGIPNSQLSASSSKSKIVLSILKQGGVLIDHPQHINVGYAKIFATGHFMSACRLWNDKVTVEKLGRTSNRISQLLTVNTHKCRKNPLPQPVTTQKIPPLLTMRIRWPKTPLEH
jgi:hypothetical protein